MIERDNIITIGRINFSNIRCDTREKKIFEYYPTLMKLAYMLMGIQRQRKIESSKTLVRNVSAIPFIISLLDTDKQLCMIVGVVPDSKSNIGSCFNSTVTKLKIEVQHDKFMSNVIVIPKDSLLEFTKDVGNNPNKSLRSIPCTFDNSILIEGQRFFHSKLMKSKSLILYKYQSLFTFIKEC